MKNERNIVLMQTPGGMSFGNFILLLLFLASAHHLKFNLYSSLLIVKPKGILRRNVGVMDEWRWP